MITLRRHRWSTRERVTLIAVLAIVMGSLFVTTYSLALGDPSAHPRTVAAIEGVAGEGFVFHRYASVAGAMRAIHLQQVYAALDLASGSPRLYVASAAGASVARVLERVGLSIRRCASSIRTRWMPTIRTASTSST